jgi:hypothetical protein
MLPTSFAGQKLDSPQTVYAINSTFRARQIGNVFDATHSKGVAQNSRLTKGG